MEVSALFKSKYRDHLRNYLPPVIANNDGFDVALDAELKDLAELASEKVCRARKASLAPRCEPSDLAERILKLNDGSEIIAGARFKNLDIDFPFVKIEQTFEMTKSRLEEIRELVGREFRNLGPLGYKFSDAPGKHSSLEKWSHTVFGDFTNVALAESPSDIEFDLNGTIDWYDEYVAQYKARLREKPELSGFVRVASLAEFEESKRDRGLLTLRDRAGFAGVMAAIESPLLGLPAIYMIESYLAQRWTGKKLAPISHRVLLRSLPGHRYVWGTIYDQNVSSLKTALRTGREIIQTEYFYRLMPRK